MARPPLLHGLLFQGPPFPPFCPQQGTPGWGCAAPLPLPRLQMQEPGLVPHPHPLLLPPPGDCSWGSPEEHREGEPLSKQMAPAPSLPSAALPFPGGTMAICLPSYGLRGALCTDRRWGTQATARMGCIGWREAKMSLVGCSLQPPPVSAGGEEPLGHPPKLPSNPAELLF